MLHEGRPELGLSDLWTTLVQHVRSASPRGCRPSPFSTSSHQHKFAAAFPAGCCNEPVRGCPRVSSPSPKLPSWKPTFAL